MFVYATAPALAQQGTAEIVGKVTDAQGAVLPRWRSSSPTRIPACTGRVVTTANGSYSVTHIVPGRYGSPRSWRGFRSLDRRGVSAVGVTATLDLMLDVGTVAEVVTVTAESPLVDVTSAEIGGHISSEEITDLPAGNRSYRMAFVGTVPSAQFMCRPPALNDTMLANGQPAAANSVMFDGAGNVDDLRGSERRRPGADREAKRSRKCRC